MRSSWFDRRLFRVQNDQARDALFWGAVCSVFWLFCHYIVCIPFGWKWIGGSVSAAFMTALFCVLREGLRAVFLSVLEDSFLKRKGAFLAVWLLFFLAAFLGNAADSGTDLFSKFLLSVLPKLCISALLTLLALYGGIVPGGIYALLTTAFPLLIPIEANIPAHLSGILGLVLPMIFLIVSDWDLSAKEQEETCLSETKSSGKRTAWISRGITGGWIIFLACFVLFFAGLLPWHPIAVVTGSMVPEIQVGDMVVVSTLDRSCQVGDIIQFQRDGVSVVHRITAVETIDGETVYITRGDANNAEDSGYVTENDLIGTVKCKVPGLGQLSLWLHNDKGDDL